MRLYHRISKQHYYEKGYYEYEQFAVPIPKNFHKIVRPLLDRELEIVIRQLPAPQEGIEIVLKPKKASGPP